MLKKLFIPIVKNLQAILYQAKRKIRKYPYLRIFRLTTSQSPKLILKADLKYKCPYFHFKFFFKSLGQYLKKNQKMDFPLYFEIVTLKLPKVF